MKTVYIYSILFFAIALLFYSCNKNEYEPIDFRHQYIGQYAVWYELNKTGPIGECKEPRGYTRTAIRIDVNYGDTDTTLKILDREVYLDSLGKFKIGSFSLTLKNKSINILYIENEGIIACNNYHIYDGHKVTK